MYYGPYEDNDLWVSLDEQSLNEAKANDLTAKTSKKISRRANRVTVKFIKRERMRNRLIFEAGEFRNQYKVKVKILDKSRLKKVKINEADIKLNCSCPAHNYQGQDYNLNKISALDGKPRSKGIKPMADKGKQFLCKHTWAVIKEYGEKAL